MQRPSITSNKPAPYLNGLCGCRHDPIFKLKRNSQANDASRPLSVAARDIAVLNTGKPTAAIACVLIHSIHSLGNRSSLE